MKIRKLNAIKFITMAFVLCAFLAPQDIYAQKKKKRKKDKTEASTPKTPEKPKDKTIKDLTNKSKKIEGLFTIYEDTITGSLQMIVKEDQLGQDYIYFTQISNGNTDSRLNRGRYGGSKIFQVTKHFNKLEFVTQNTSFYFDPDSAISKSKDANISHGNMASIVVEAHDKETGEYLIKADDMFLKETLQQLKPPRFPGSSPFEFTLGNLDKTKTKVVAINNYEDNTNLEVEYVYSSPSIINGGSNAIADGRNVSIKVFNSFIAIPDNDYTIRFDDPRVGYFTTQVDDQTATNSIPYRDLVHRWNLQKKDPNAALSEPIKPITWWMENSTPVEWRETITKGVLEWNKAFEKAGFKNAMVVKMQPDDATWDAGDINYNVLRWTSSANPPFGGYGPSFVNPQTGEIMGADIMLEYVHFTNRVMYDKLFELSALEEAFDPSDYLKENKMYCSMGHLMHENTMFGQAVLEVAGANDTQMERMKKQSMIALIMHEVGHTLGLNHNMKASQLFTPEQLADADFIKDKCLTGSVMDYAAINLTKDRALQGQYYDTTVGPYDIWAIQFGYTPFKTEAEKMVLLNKSTQPELIFGNDADDMRAPGKAIDPRVMVGDLSNDQIGYSIDRIELVNSMMNEIKTKFSKTGESFQEMRRAYYILSGQRANATGIISRFIGGVYVDRAMIGQAGATKPYTPVSLEDQKRAMNALKIHVFAPDAFSAPNDLYNYLALQRRGYNFFGGPEDPKIHDQVLNYQRNVLAHILHPNTLQRITDSELYGNEYELSMFMTDLNNAIFKADISGNVNSFRQNLQIEYTNLLVGALTGKQSGLYSNSAKSMALYSLKSIRTMAAPSGNISSRAHKQHLRTLIDNALKEVK